MAVLGDDNDDFGTRMWVLHNGWEVATADTSDALIAVSEDPASYSEPTGADRPRCNILVDQRGSEDVVVRACASYDSVTVRELWNQRGNNPRPFVSFSVDKFLGSSPDEIRRLAAIRSGAPPQSGAFTWLPCADVEDFLNVLQPIDSQLNFPPRPLFIFCGDGDATWPLLPTALRPDGRKQLHMFTATGRTAALRPDQVSEGTQRQMELELLVDFRAAVDRRGLQMSGVPTSRPVSYWQDRVNELMRGPEGWLTSDWIPVAALAQHYGLPTRLLDWTHSSSVAAFFAARSAFRQLQKAGGPQGNAVRSREATGLLAVWRIAATHVQTEPRLEIFHPPYAGNPNLAAQQGVFTHWREYDANLAAPVDVRPVDERVARAPHFDLTKIALPASLAATLLVVLSNRVVDSGSMFPGYGGIVDALMETGLADRSGVAYKGSLGWSRP